MTFHGWRRYIEIVHAERAAAARALSLWSGKLSHKCLLAWVRYTHTRIRHRHQNDEAQYHRATKLAGGHLHAWHSAWVARANERALMTRSLSFFTQGNQYDEIELGPIRGSHPPLTPPMLTWR